MFFMNKPLIKIYGFLGKVKKGVRRRVLKCECITFRVEIKCREILDILLHVVSLDNKYNICFTWLYDLYIKWF